MIRLYELSSESIVGKQQGRGTGAGYRGAAEDGRADLGEKCRPGNRGVGSD
ncbi:hypothetical protein DPMN_063721 [Dreissena polymorpha]|uniref:Uncharacterized protein n=1 Tax=Dreissena polymorpha TaxID=45954 RepID=A0A9D4HLF4_DREPO|nr:hypothetical protein DPMN_063721 [Dreissena polymorpha]